MDIQLFLDAPLQIQLHVISAVEALILGPYLLVARKGTRLHRVLGYIWVVNMLIAASTSMFISQLRMVGPFSFIHLLSIFAFVSLYRGVRAARRGNIAEHVGNMRGLYLGGVVVAGALTFLPGRMLNRMFFPNIDENLGFGIVLAVVLVAFATYRFRFAIRRALKKGVGLVSQSQSQA